MPLTAGTRIGPYEVLSSLGAGGMGEVYRARDTKLGRDVALKVLPQSVAMLPDRLARFRREAQLLAALNHPNIAQIHGLEEAPDGTLALVMELVDGPTLEELISGSGLKAQGSRGSGLRAQGSGPDQAPSPKPQAPSLAESLHIASQIVAAMEAAHAQGIIHRDLKPANIKVRADGTVKVLDFGLAKALDPAQGSGLMAQGSVSNSPTITSPAMTELGMILGTAAYMAPEQAKGRPVDKRADIWAFGCVLYEMLTGARAFAGDDVSDTLANILKSEPDWTAVPAGTPVPIRRLLRRCLAKSVTDRLPDIGVARLEIAEARAQTAGEDAAAPATVAIAPTSRRPVALLAMLGAAGVALLAAAPLLWSHLREVPAPAPTIRFAVPPPPDHTFHPESAMPTVSPDGRFLVFRAIGNNGPANLWLRALDSMEARQLPGTERATRAFWSPDSQSIVFPLEGSLKRMALAGGPVQTITELKAQLGIAWNRDGTILIGDQGGPVTRVPAAGGKPSLVTTLDTTRKELGHAFPQFLPDGRRFIFTTLPENVLMLGSMDEPGHRELLHLGTHAAYAAPGYLLYVIQGTLMAQPFDPARAEVHGEPVRLAEGVRMLNVYGVFSASDTGVLVIESNEGFEGGRPVWVDRGGRTSQIAAAEFGDALYPRLSPDGRRVALIRSGDIWVGDLGGLPPVRLTFDGRDHPHFIPLWTRDGRRLIYETQQLPHLQILPADGSTTTPTDVATQGHFHPHSWLPGGAERVVAGRVGPNMDIVAISLDEGAAVTDLVATPNREGAEGLSLSPDGRWMAYAANPTGLNEIWVRPTAGGAPIRVSPNGGIEPIWSRNGRELFYIDNRARQMMSVAIHAGNEFRFSPPVPLFSTAAMVMAPQPPSYDVAADGRFLMIEGGSRQPVGSLPLTIVVNWADAISGLVRH
jgi:Tol biopolymer transport system component